MTYTDETLMPWGKHKGTALANVPASYLKWIWDEEVKSKGSFLKKSPSLKAYIEDNLDVINKEIKG